MPRATAAFAGVSIAGGVAIGAAPAVAEVVLPRLFATQTNGAVFWSGYPEAQTAAIEFAEATGGSTIEGMLGGSVLNATNGVTRAISGRFNDFLWNRASTYFAEGASGTAAAFLKESIRPGSAWETIEKPILQQSGVKIVTHLVP
jgi:hypothetical protein